jgi:hypothetical protein
MAPYRPFSVDDEVWSATEQYNNPLLNLPTTPPCFSERMYSDDVSMRIAVEVPTVNVKVMLGPYKSTNDMDK